MLKSSSHGDDNRFPDATGRTEAATKKPRISAGLGYWSRPFYLPVPVRVEVCGLPTALSATFNVPVLVPVAVGVNVTLILQLVLAARLVVQVLVETLKSPVVEIAMLFSATVCLLASVNTLAALVVPTVCFE
jgi:hypothetical protein